jgi:hypothetical protein
MATRYRKPHSINAISVGLLLFLGIAVYVAIYTWPVYSLASRAKGVLLDSIPMLYRANLRSADVASVMINDLKKAVPMLLRKEGVKDPNLEVIFNRSPTEVSIEAHFVATAVFPVINKSFDFHLSPRAVTDAARIEW